MKNTEIVAGKYLKNIGKSIDNNTPKTIKIQIRILLYQMILFHCNLLNNIIILMIKIIEFNANEKYFRVSLLFLNLVKPRRASVTRAAT